MTDSSTARDTDDQERGSFPLADMVISVILLLVFIGALKMALGFPFKAGLVPRIVSGGGIVFTLASIARQLWQWRTDAPPPPPVAVDDDEFDEEYVFHTATRKEWAEALSWFIGFFVAVWFLGTYVTVPVFATAYLVKIGKVKPWWAVLYAAVAWALLYLMLGQTLHLPVPTGSLFE